MKRKELAPGTTVEFRWMSKNAIAATAELEMLARQARYCCHTLAALCGLSASQLQRRFRATHQESVRHWLKRLRLQHAYAQLAEGESVWETTNVLGFRHIGHFSRSFKKHFGIDPSVVLTSAKMKKASAQGFSSYPVQMQLF